jgi:5'-3' exonuclease
VELIKEFGSVEAVLDRAAEVKRKAYRESLEQNRDTFCCRRNSSPSIAMCRCRSI